MNEQLKKRQIKMKMNQWMNEQLNKRQIKMKTPSN